MIINERNDRKNRVLAAAGQMMTAARTAPKAKGSDIIEVAIVEGEDLEILSTEMKRLGQIKKPSGPATRCRKYSSRPMRHAHRCTTDADGSELRALRLSVMSGKNGRRPVCFQLN